MAGRWAVLSLKRNIIASLVGQGCVMILGFVMVPTYLRYMGAEAFGLVGLFTMLQAWFNLLDVGLTSTLARETARFRGGGLDPARFGNLVRALEGVFVAVAIAGAGAVCLAAEAIATRWLNVEHLAYEDVSYALRAMAVAVALRWVGGLYRGLISGSERLVWLSAYTTAGAILRYAGVIPVLIFVGAGPRVFFTFQLMAALLEFFVIWSKQRAVFPRISSRLAADNPWTAIKPVLGFSVVLALTSSIGSLLTQIDRFVLSRLLPLSEYGYFSLAVLVASGVIAVSGAVGAAVLPRLARIEAEGDGVKFRRLYREATRAVVAIATAAAVTLGLFAEVFVTVWTGDADRASHIAPILKAYAAGNAVFSVSAFAYYLQYAKGDLRLHLIGNIIFLAVLVPLIFLGVSRFGGLGAGYAWLVANLGYLLLWVPLVHRRLSPGLHWRWFMVDVLPGALAVGGVATALSFLLPVQGGAVMQVAMICAAGILALASGLFVAWILGCSDSAGPVARDPG